MKLNVYNGATYANIDMRKNKKDERRMFVIEDNGVGMDLDKLRQCMSLGYSLKDTIGQSYVFKFLVIQSIADSTLQVVGAKAMVVGHAPQTTGVNCSNWKARKMKYIQSKSVPHANLRVLDKLIVARHEIFQWTIETLKQREKKVKV
ncbi:microrchidia 7-like protein [Tanacetum coccineum]